MKKLKMLFISILVIMTINYVTTASNLVYADDDFEKYHENHEGVKGEDSYEDIGEAVGWGTVITMIIAGLIYPIRRSMKLVITNFPGLKKMYISISRFFGKYHIFIGIIALVLSIIHGIFMYLSDGELESEGIIGLGAVGLIVIASIVGSVLFKNKKVKSLRTTHTILIVLAFLVGAIHIFVS